MGNLTEDQITLLTWMKTGHTFRVCSEYCSKYGEIQPQLRLPVRVFRKTIDKLFQNGLITYTSDRAFGVRWDVFALTQKGKQVL